MGAAEELYEQLLFMSGSLRPAEVEEYALSRGWKHVPGIKDDMLVFDHQSHGLRQLIVPKRRTDGYTEAIAEVLIRLEACEGRGIRDIARDMRKRRKVGLSFKVRLKPCAKWQKRPVFSRCGGYFVWLFIWLNFTWEYDD